MIDSFFNGLKKLLVGVIALVFVFAITYIPQPHTKVAEAQLAVVESGPVGFSTYVDTAATVSMELIDKTLNGLAWAVAKQMIALMLDSMVDWINSGFEGNPAFVQNLDRYLLEAADIVVGRYIEELGGPLSFVCEPFRLDVQLSLALAYDRVRNEEVPSCTVTEIFDNVNDFTDFITGDFEQGGWGAWMELTSSPNQTPYGAVLEAESQARAAIVNEQGESIAELGFGNGFLSGKLCETPEGPGAEEECFITKPGRVIEEQLNKALGRGGDSLVEADQINEVVVALIGQIAQRAITGAAGLLGLSGGANYTPYSRGSFADEVRTGNTTIVGGVSPVGTSVPENTQPLDSAAFQLTNQIESALAASQNLLNQIDDYTTQFNAIIDNANSTDFAVGQAQGSLLEAASLQSQINQSAPAATVLVNRYVALEAAYANATPEEQITIRTEQGTLIQEFSALGLPSESQINATLARWDAILSVAAPTRPTGPNAQLCEELPDLAVCRANP